MGSRDDKCDSDSTLLLFPATTRLSGESLLPIGGYFQFLGGGEGQNKERQKKSAK